MLEESGLSEFAWKHLKGARERFAALKMIEFAVSQCAAGVMRIDVLTWSIKDKGTAVRLPDKVKNLQYMYCQLSRNVFRLRWPNDAVWRLYPDEHTAIHWDYVRHRLDYSSVRTRQQTTMDSRPDLGLVLDSEFLLRTSGREEVS